MTNVWEAEGKVELQMVGNGIHRNVLFKLYRESPSADDSGSWKPYQGVGADSRPYLAYGNDGPQVGGSWANVYHKNPDYANVVYALVDFHAEEEPAGVPLSYRVDIMEDRVEGGPIDVEKRTRAIGRTQMMVKHPGTGEFILPDSDGSDGFRAYGDDAFYSVKKDMDSGDYVNWVLSSSNDSPWLEPDGWKGASGRGGTGSEMYHRGAFERPWGVGVRIPVGEYSQWASWNQYHYRGTPSEANIDIANVKRLVTTEYDGKTALDNEVLAQVAENLDSAAEASGLLSPVQKLQFVVDFVQYMPYVDDTYIPYYKPRVKHPVVMLKEMGGDCEDKSVLALALLYQDAFPEYKLAMYAIMPTMSSSGHVGVGVHKDIFDESIVDEMMADSAGSHEDYFYLEATYPERRFKYCS